MAVFVKIWLLFFSIQGAGLGGMKPNTIILGWPNAWRKREEESWRVFVDTIRNTAAAKMALLVPKGVQRYPDSGVSTIVFYYFLLKGQLISKYIFGTLNSPIKRTKKNQLYYYDTSGQLVFVRFLEETEDTKKIFRN